MKKLAVIFPGIGYHVDKPLLYYGKKLASDYGYEIKEIPYKNFPKNVKGSKEKMEQAFGIAIEQTEHLLETVSFFEYDRLLFISKSIGTVVAASYAMKHNLEVNHIFYTPVEEFFSVLRENKGQGDGAIERQKGIVFHGTKDPWAKTKSIEAGCKEKNLPLYIIEGANHSLETGDVLKDLKNLQFIMEITKDHLKNMETRERRTG